jgi:bifunctional enzyme CysN/CysC
LKLATLRATVRLLEIVNVLDASDLSSERGKQEVERHEVAECVFEAAKPIVFDISRDIEATGRFVLVDNYEIAGGGIITENASTAGSSLQEHVRQREAGWEQSAIPVAARAGRYGHRSKFVVITGASESVNRAIAQALEKRLFDESRLAYYLGVTNIDRGLDSDVLDSFDQREERVRRLGELARILTDSGQIFITTITDVDVHDVKQLIALNAPSEILVVVAGATEYQDVHADVQISDGQDLHSAVEQVYKYLQEQEVIPDYCI